MKTDINYDLIKDMSFSDLQGYIKENFWYSENATGVAGVKKISAIIRAITKLCGIYPSNEQYIYMLANPHYLACTACAGAGKTTMSLYRGTIASNYLGIKGEEILFLAYNRDAAASFKERLDMIQTHVDNQKRKERNAAFLAGKPAPEIKFTVPTDMYISTLHAWCVAWVQTYRHRWKINNFTIATENEINNLMQKIVENVLKDRFAGEHALKLTNGHISAFVRLFQFVEETESINNPVAWVVSTDRNYLSDFSDEELIKVFTTYKQTKELARVVDYTSVLRMMKELLEDPQYADKIRKHYKFIIVDEYQDFTPLMNSILKLMIKGSDKVAPYPECYLTCIGDDDQAIYQFKGASTKNFLNFKNNFSMTEGDTKIVSMSINRRCGKEILDIAANIAESMGDERIEKPVWGIHEGGSVKSHDYTSNGEQIESLLSRIDLNNLSNSVICYRNQSSSAFLTIQLMEKGIPFKLGNGIAPLQDIISRTYLNVLQMLYDPEDEETASKAFYKIMPGKGPFRRDYYSEIFMKHKEKREDYDSGIRVRSVPFWSHDLWDKDLFELERAMPGWTKSLNRLKDLSARIRDLGDPMSTYMPEVFMLVDKYYLNNLLTGLLAGRFSTEFKNYIRGYFSKDISFRKFILEYREKLKVLEENASKGIYVSTFHSLKGLEYDNVYVLDMDDNIFPGSDVSNPQFTEAQRKEAEYSARCLLYVVTTRAKQNLELWFSKQRPSQYIQYFSKSDLLSDIQNVDFMENEIDLKDLEILKDSSDSKYIYCSKLKVKNKSYMPNEISEETATSLFGNDNSAESLDMDFSDFENVEISQSDTSSENSTSDLDNLFGEFNTPPQNPVINKSSEDLASVLDNIFGESPMPELDLDLGSNKEVVVFEGKPKITSLLNNLVEED